MAADTQGDDLTSAQIVSLTPNTNIEIPATIGDGDYGASDVDLFKVDLAPGQTINVDVDAYVFDDGTYNDYFDSYLRIFDSSGAEVDSNDYGYAANDYMGGNSYDSYLTFTTTTGGIHYIGVTANGNTAYDPASAGSGSSAGTGVYRLQLVADQPAGPSLSIGDVSVDEGAGTMSFDVTLTAGATGSVTVTYSTNDDSATTPEDYAGLTGSLTFAVGETVKSATIDIVEDSLSEGDESFTIELSNPSGATIADAIGVVTIVDNDLPPGDLEGDALGEARDVTLQPNVEDEFEATIGDGSYGSADVDLFKVSLAPGQTIKVDVDAYAFDDGTFNSTFDSYLRIFDNSGSELDSNDSGYAANDYLGGNSYDSYLSFTASVGGTYYIGVTAIGNTVYDPTIGGSGSSAGTGIYRLQLVADGPAGPSLSIGDVSVNEGAGTVSFDVTLTSGATGSVTVTYSTIDDSATTPEDYAGLTGMLTFGVGETVQSATIGIVDDAISEGAESFTIELTSPSGATIADGTGVVTILDNDLPPGDLEGDSLGEARELTLQPNVADEFEATIGDGNYGNADVDLFKVALAAGQTIKVDIDSYYFDDWTMNGSLDSYLRIFSSDGTELAANDSGYASNDAMNGYDSYIVFAASDSDDYYIGVSGSGNSNYNPNTAGTGTSASTGIYRLQLVTDTPPLPAISISDLSVNEDAGDAIFTVTLSSSSSQVVIVNYATTDGTATSPGDYTSDSGQITFAAGETTQSISIGITLDAVEDDGETFSVTLSAPSGATLANATATATITNVVPPGSPPYILGGSGMTDPVTGLPLADATNNSSLPPSPVEYLTNLNTTLSVSADGGILSRARDDDGDQLVAGLSPQSPHQGTVTVNDDGSFTFTPATDFTGTDDIWFTVTDGVFTITVAAAVTVGGHNIVANFNSYEVLHDTSLTLTDVEGVLRNDWHTQGLPITAAIADQAINGTAAVNAGGGIVYTPAAGFVGTDRFTYTVTDGTATTNPVNVFINVVNTAPTAADDDVYTVWHGRTLTVGADLGVLANDYDYDYDAYAAFLVDDVSNGVLLLGADGSFSYTPDTGAQDFVGVDSFTYKIDDGISQSTATVTIDVTNRTPVATVNREFVHHGDSISGDVLADDYDRDGDPLQAFLVSAPSHGTVTLNPDGSYNYQPTPLASGDDFVGTDSFSYHVFDGAAYSEPATVSIENTNTIPLATRNDYSVKFGDTVSGNVLSNDVDADSTDTLTAVFHSGASQGSLTLNSNGSFTFDPGRVDSNGDGNVDANDHYFSGQVTFNYLAYDGAQYSDPIPVTITVTNHVPVAIDDFFSFEHDSSGNSGELVVNDLDFDGDQSDLNVVLDEALPTESGLTLHDDGQFYYTPPEDFAGEFTFSYKVIDAAGAESEPATVVIAVTNDKIYAVDTYKSTMEGQSVSGSVTPDVLNKDGDDLEFSLLEPVAGLTFGSDGSFQYQPPNGTLGVVSFDYSVTDGPSTATATVYIEIEPYAAMAIDNQFALATGAEVIQGNVLTDDWTNNPGGITTHTVEKISQGLLQGDSGPFFGQLLGDPELSPDGTFTYDPYDWFTGIDSFEYNLIGEHGQVVGQAMVILQVRNEPPIANDDQLSTDEDTPLTISQVDLKANDSDPNEETTDELTLSIVRQPRQGSLSLGTLPAGAPDLTYIPRGDFNGQDSFTYILTDPQGAISTEGLVTIDVAPVNDPIYTATDYAKVDEDSGPVTIDVLSNDFDLDGAIDTTGVTLTVSQPAHGTATVSGTSVDYTPDPNFYGEDTFAYTVDDGTTSQAGTVVVFVNAVNDLPVANPDTFTFQTTYIGPGGAIKWPLGVGSNDTDVDFQDIGNTESDTNRQNYQNSNFRLFEVVSGPSKGTLEEYAVTSGTFTYIPYPESSGPDSFTYKVYDPDWDESNETTVTINYGGGTTSPPSAPPVPTPGTVSVCPDFELLGPGTYIRDNIQAILLGDFDVVGACIGPTSVFVEVEPGGYHFSVSGDGSVIANAIWTAPSPDTLVAPGGLHLQAEGEVQVIPEVIGDLMVVAGDDITTRLKARSVIAYAGNLNGRGEIGGGYAGDADILGEIIATNGDVIADAEGSIMADITAMQTVRRVTALDGIAGSITAINGDIWHVWAQDGNIGGPGKTITAAGFIGGIDFDFAGPDEYDLPYVGGIFSGGEILYDKITAQGGHIHFVLAEGDIGNQVTPIEISAFSDLLFVKSRQGTIRASSITSQTGEILGVTAFRNVWKDEQGTPTTISGYNIGSESNNWENLNDEGEFWFSMGFDWHLLHLQDFGVTAHVGNVSAIMAAAHDLYRVKAGVDVMPGSSITAGSGDVYEIVIGRDNHAPTSVGGDIDTYNVGRNNKQTLVAGGGIRSLQVGRDTEDSLSAGGGIEHFSVGRDTVGTVTVNGTYSGGGTASVDDLYVGRDIIEEVQIGGDLNEALIGRDVLPDFTVGGSLGIVDPVTNDRRWAQIGRDLRGNLSAGVIEWLDVGRDISGNVTSSQYIERVYAGRTIGKGGEPLYIKALGGHITDVVAGAYSWWTASTKAGRMDQVEVSATSSIGNVSVHASHGKGGDLSGKVTAGTTIGSVTASGSIDAEITANGRIGLIIAGASNGGDFDGLVTTTSGGLGSLYVLKSQANGQGGTLRAPVTATNGGIDVIMTSRDIDATVDATGDIGVVWSGGSILQDVTSSGGDIGLGALPQEFWQDRAADFNSWPGAAVAQLTGGSIGVTNVSWLHGFLNSYDSLDFLFDQLGTQVTGVSSLPWLVGFYLGGEDILQTWDPQTSAVPIYARYDIKGNVTAHNNLWGVRAGRHVSSGGGNVSIQASNGLIGDVEAGYIFGGNIDADIYGKNSIRNVTAHGLRSLQVNPTGEIVDPADVPDKPDSNNWEWSLNVVGDMLGFGDNDAGPLRRLTAQPAAGGDGNINGTITSDGDVGSVTAFGKISSEISANSVARIWALGNIEKSITVENGPLNVYSWGMITSPTISKISSSAGTGNMTIYAYGDIESAVISKDPYLSLNWGSVDIVSWDNIRGSQFALGSIELWAFNNLLTSSSMSVKGMIAGAALSTISGSFATPFGAALVGWNLTNVEVDGLVAILAATGSISESQAYGGHTLAFAGDNIQNVTTVGLIADAIAGGNITGSSITAYGFQANFDQSLLNRPTAPTYDLGDGNGTQELKLQEIPETEAEIDDLDIPEIGKDILESLINSLSGWAYVVAKGDVAQTDIAAMTTIEVEADNVTEGNFGGALSTDPKSLTVSANGDVTTSMTAGDELRVAAMGSMNASFTSAGTIFLDSADGVAGTVNGEHGVELRTWGPSSANVTASNGAVLVDAYGDVSGTITSRSMLDVTSWGNLNATVDSGGYADVFTSGNVDGSIKAGGGAMVEAWGDITSAVSAGDGTVSYLGDDVESTPPENLEAIVVSHGNVSGTVTSSGSAYVSAHGSISQKVWAKGASAKLTAGSNISQQHEAKQGLTAISGGTISGELTSLDAGVTAYADVEVSALTVTAENSANITSATTDVTITLDQADGNVNANAIDGDLTLTVTARDAELSAFAKGLGDVTVSNGYGVRTATVSAGGDLNAEIEADDEISVFAKGNIDGTYKGTAAAAEVHVIGTNVDGEFESGGASLEVVGFGTVNGQYTTGPDGDGNINILGKGAVNVQVESSGSATVLSVESIAGQINADGAVAVTGGQAITATSSRSLSAKLQSVESTINSNVTSAGSIDAVADGTITGTLTAGDAAGAGSGVTPSLTADILVISKQNVTGTHTAPNDISVSTRAAANVTVDAGNDASIFADSSISGQIDADHDAEAFSKSDISAPITAGNDAFAWALGGISSAVTAGQSADVFSNQSLSGAVTATAGDAKITVRQNLIGAVTAGNDADVFAIQGTQASITASTGNATVASWGNVVGTVTAGISASVYVVDGELQGDVIASQGIDAFARGEISGTLTAGSHVLASSHADVTGNVTAGADADVTAKGSVTSTINAGGIAGILAMQDVTGEVNGDLGAYVTGMNSINNTTNSSAGPVHVFSGGSAQITIDAELDAKASAYGTANVTISDSANADVWSLDALTVDIQQTANASVSSLANVTATLNITGNADITVDGATDVSGSTGGNLDILSLGPTDVDATAAGDASVTSRGVLTVGLTGQNVSMLSVGSILGSANASAELSAVSAADITGTYSGTDKVDVLAGGNGIVTITSQGEVWVGGLATMSADVSTTGDLTAFAGVDLLLVITAAQNASAGSLLDASVSGTVANDIYAIAGNDLQLSSLSAGHNLGAAAYGDLNGTNVSATNDIEYLVARGDLTGDFTAGNEIQIASSYSAINATFVADTINQIRAYGAISGALTAATAIHLVASGDEVSASLTAPQIGTVSQHNPQVNNHWPQDLKLSLAAAEASLRELIRDVELIDLELAADRLPIPGMVAAIKEGANRSFSPPAVSQAEIGAWFTHAVFELEAIIASKYLNDDFRADEGIAAFDALTAQLQAIKTHSDGTFTISQRALTVAAEAFKKEITTLIDAQTTAADAKSAGKDAQNSAKGQYVSSKQAIWDDVFALRVRTWVLDRVEMYLDIVGSIPDVHPVIAVVTTITDLATLALSVARRKSYVEIGLNGISFIPGLAGTGSKVVKNSFRVGKKLAKSGANVAGILADGARRGDWCAIGKAAKAAGIPAAIHKRLPNCFIAGTQVWHKMPDPPIDVYVSNEAAPSLQSKAAVTLAFVGLLSSAAIERRRKRKDKEEARRTVDLIDEFFGDDREDSIDNNLLFDEEPWQRGNEQERASDHNLRFSEIPWQHQVDDCFASTWEHKQGISHPHRMGSAIAKPRSASNHQSRSGFDESQVIPSVSVGNLVIQSQDRFKMSWSAAVLAVCLFMAAMVGFWPRPSIQPLQLATTTSAPEQPLRSNIEDLKVGDYVLAKDPETGEISQRKITRLFRRESDHLRVLQLRSPMGQTQFIRTTDEHPFFLHDESQKLAGELRVGDLVSHGNGNASQIISSLREEHPEGIEVFNFEVEVDHTYFVSGDLNASVPLWVHNDCVYVHVDAQDNITYIGITNDFHRRAGEHFEDGTKSGVRMLQVTDDYTGKDAHDIVRTLEGKLIRQKIKDAKVDETLPVKEQLELADLDNLNRGRIEERFEKGVEIEDHVYDITDAIDEAPIK